MTAYHGSQAADVLVELLAAAPMTAKEEPK